MEYKKINIVFYILFFSIFNSCIDCELWRENLANDQCKLVVLQRPDIKDNFFNFRGVNPDTGKKCDCVSETSYRWWDLYADKIEVGDTIIKRKGELIFYIHKKIRYSHLIGSVKGGFINKYNAINIFETLLITDLNY